MTSIADQLRAIADQIDGNAAKPSSAEPSASEPAIPENWVRIRPTYPRVVAYRDYPDPQFVSSYDGSPVTTITGYASSAQELWHSPHFDYKMQGGRLFDIGTAFNEMLKTDGPAAYPKILDRMAFPLDYADPANDTPPLKPGERDPWISSP